jgi:hypothetical protein
MSHTIERPAKAGAANADDGARITIADLISGQRSDQLIVLLTSKLQTKTRGTRRTTYACKLMSTPQQGVRLPPGNQTRMVNNELLDKLYNLLCTFVEGEKASSDFRPRRVFWSVLECPSERGSVEE